MEDCISLWYGLFGKREMREFLKTKRELKRQLKRELKGRCGINFTFIHLRGFLVPRPFEGFLFQFYSYIG